MYNKKYFFKSLFVLPCLALLFIHWAEKKPLLRNGLWRSEIIRTDGHSIVFNFEVKDSQSKKIIYIINGSDRLLVDSVQLRNDSVFIELPFFDSRFAARIDDHGNLSGQWIKQSGDRKQLLPFKAVHNIKKRFEVSAKPIHTISGRWAVGFKGRNNKIDSAVGEFRQQGSRLTGTFLTPTGDYRFLEGVVSGDSLKLSGFDGSFAFLFVAKIENANTISNGVFYSGATGKREWSAIKDANAKLPESFSGTSLQGDEQKLIFSFSGLDGKKIANDDPRFKNKVLVIQVLGSWCPNCIDETKFLSQYYTSNKQKGVELIGLAYERKADAESSVKALRPLVKRFNVQYPVALSGVSVSDSLRAEKTLPQVGKINAFPTTIFVDKKGYLRKIHSGFNGPATGEHYEIYKKEFEATVEELLSE